MNSPLLTIIIPTLDRLELLKLSVAALLPQVERHNNLVEFVIVNYVHEDNTSGWLAENFTGHATLTYIDYVEKIGIVESVMLCIQLAKGEYVWVFGDDDLPMPFALDTILDLLQNPTYGDADILYFNCIRSDVTMKRYTSVYDARVELAPIKLSTDELVNEFHLNLGLIITMVFRRQNWLAGKDFYKEKYYGYGWLAPLIAGSKDGKCVYYPFPISVHRIGGQRYVNKWPLYILVGVPAMLSDFHQQGIIKTNPLRTWQDTYSLLDFIKVLTVAKAFRYKASHPLWNDAVKYVNKGSKRFFLNVFRYAVPPWLAKITFNAGAEIKQSFKDQKLS